MLTAPYPQIHHPIQIGWIRTSKIWTRNSNFLENFEKITVSRYHSKIQSRNVSVHLDTRFVNFEFKFRTFLCIRSELNGGSEGKAMWALASQRHWSCFRCHVATCNKSKHQYSQRKSKHQWPLLDQHIGMSHRLCRVVFLDCSLHPKTTTTWTAKYIFMLVTTNFEPQHND
jgi:hypothetical protein